MKRLFWLMVWTSACASSPKVADIVEMGRAGDVAGIVEAQKRTDSDAVRVAILEQLGQFPDDVSGRALVLKQAEISVAEEVKLAALRAAAKFSGEDATEVIIARLEDPWPAVRELAQTLLIERAASARDELSVRLTTSASPLMRAACVRLLETVAKIDATSREAIAGQLVVATNDDAPKVRESAALALGALGIGSARARLMELMRTDPDAGVRMSAERAIQKLGESGKPTAIVAVLPLKNDTGLADAELDRFGSQIAEYLAARLSSGKVCEIVDPAKVEAAIAELKKVGAAMYDGDSPNAPAIGRFKIANQLVYGSLQKQGNVFTIVLRRMEVSTLAEVPGAAVTVQGYRADLESLKVRAADQLLASFR